ncbi:MAG UNVERIFIED_CONTAM: hypothetical protein LVR18_35280 [Planctomycetaceae bacterium]|jgi:hypothetical protein
MVPARTHTVTPRLRGQSPQLSRSVTTVTDLPVLSVLTIATPALTLPPPKLRGQSPQLSRSVTTVTDLSVPSVPTIATPHSHCHPQAAGTVPATGSLCNDYYRSSGSSGSDERSARTHTADPAVAGTVPQPGCCVTTVTDLQVLLVLTNERSVRHAHRRRPRSFGDCPRNRVAV